MTKFDEVLMVAHRAGNDLEALRAAEAAGADLVEADVWWWRGRLEVRHTKTMGPIPLLWDRWLLAPGWTPRLTLEDLLRAARPQTELMLDLKGSAIGLSALVRETMAREAPDRAYTVSSQWWDQLLPFESVEAARVVYSIGNERMRAAIGSRLAGRLADGVAIHERLLTPAWVERLRGIASTVFSWPINNRRRLDELVGWGVNGIISDQYEALFRLGDHPRRP